jgi:WD40 repeat protein
MSSAAPIRLTWVFAVLVACCMASAPGAGGAAVRAFPPPGNIPEVTAVAFAPDGKRVLAATDQGRLILWEIPLAHEVWESVFLDRSGKSKFARREQITVVAFAADGKVFLTGDDEGVVRLWDATRGKEIRALPKVKDKGAIATAHFSADGKEVLGAYGVGTVVVWNAATGKRLRSFETGTWDDPPKVKFSSDGRYFLASGEDHIVRLWRVADGRLLRAFRVPEGNLAGLAFSPTGRYVLTSHSRDAKPGCTLRLWEVASGRPAGTWTKGFAVGPSLAFLPDHRRALMEVAGMAPAILDLLTGKVRRLAPTSRGYLTGERVILSPDGKQALLGVGRDLRLWDLEADEEVCTLFMARPYPTVFECLAMSPDGKRVVGKRGEEGPYFLWDTATGKPIAKLPKGTVAASLASGGRLALVGEYDGTLAVWDLEAGKKVRELMKPKKPIPGLKLPPKTKPEFGPPFYSVALSPDGRWAAADNTTLGMLWDITTGKKRGPLVRLGLPRFTSDSTQIIGFSRRRISVWDVKSGRLLRTIPIEGELQNYVLSPQGRWVALAFSNKPGEVWDVVSGKRLRLLDRLETDLQKISPGGKVLLCRLQNGGMRLTSLKDGKLLREIPPRRLREGVWIGFSQDDMLVWFEGHGPRFHYYDPATGREVSRVEPMKVQR